LRGGPDVRLAKEAVHDGEHVCPRCNQGGAILRSNPADGNHGQAELAPRRLEEIEARGHRVGLGRRRKESTEGHVLRACGLCPSGALELVVAGHPDDGLIAQAAARLARVGVIAPQVNAVGAHADRKLDVVIDDQGDAVGAADREDLDRFTCPPGAIAALVAILDHLRAALDGRGNLVRQAGGGRQAERRDGVEPPPLRHGAEA
jgi:hypothetical protein